ncbi:MAG: cyclodeaminase [Pseudomonadota bacterium]
MPDIKIIGEKDLRKLVQLDLDIVDCVQDAFAALATKKVVMPPILHLSIAEANGEMDAKTAYIPGMDSFALKSSSGFFDNPKQGLPALGGLMVVYSAKTGVVEAVLLDNGYLTDVRTAAAGAVAARCLARTDASRAGVLGTGMQARLQLQALTLVRPIREAKVWGRDPEKAKKLAAIASEELGIPVTASKQIDEVAEASDILITATPATKPLIGPGHLRPGLHITAMGSDADFKCEIAPEVLAAADLYVPDRLSQCVICGELRAAIAAGAVPADQGFPELGEIIVGKAEGRTSNDAVTLCDLTGTGIQDTAIAILARARAQAADAGMTFQN